MKPNPPTLPDNLLDLLLDAVCIVDGKGDFHFISAAGERIFGYAPQEMVGRPVTDFVHPQDLPSTLDTLKDVLQGEPVPYFENRYLRKDGKVAHILWSARWSEADNVRIAVAHDITERKRGESKQAAIYAIAEAALGADDLAALFQCVHRVVDDLLQATNFTVALTDTGTEGLSFPYHTDQHARPADARTVKVCVNKKILHLRSVMMKCWVPTF